MENCIELLEIDLIDDEEKLNEIDHWIKIFNWSNGWHYDLDIIWILKILEELRLPFKATILDAGAGLGLTQFILASKGYNVISLDFSEREVPKNARGIFTIDVTDNDLGEYHHPYMDFMDYGQKVNYKQFELMRIKKNAFNPQRIIWYLKYKILHNLSLYYSYKERRKEHNNFGTITFLKGSFNNIPLDSSSIDAMVSLSAFEHNVYDDMPGSIQEFNRVLKDESFMLITTSAAEEKDWFHKPSLGWCLTSQTLAKWFNVNKINFNYSKCYQKIINSKKFKNRICDYYKHNGDSGLPYADLKNAKYIPVGIIRQKVNI